MDGRRREPRRRCAGAGGRRLAHVASAGLDGHDGGQGVAERGGRDEHDGLFLHAGLRHGVRRRGRVQVGQRAGAHGRRRGHDLGRRQLRLRRGGLDRREHADGQPFGQHHGHAERRRHLRAGHRDRGRHAEAHHEPRRRRARARPGRPDHRGRRRAPRVRIPVHEHRQRGVLEPRLRQGHPHRGPRAGRRGRALPRQLACEQHVVLHARARDARRRRLDRRQRPHRLPRRLERAHLQGPSADLRAGEDADRQGATGEQVGADGP